MIYTFILRYERPFHQQAYTFDHDLQYCVPMNSAKSPKGRWIENAIRCYDSIEEAENNAYDNQSIWKLNVTTMTLTKVRDAKEKRHVDLSKPRRGRPYKAQ